MANLRRSTRRVPNHSAKLRQHDATCVILLLKVLTPPPPPPPPTVPGLSSFSLHSLTLKQIQESPSQIIPQRWEILCYFREELLHATPSTTGKDYLVWLQLNSCQRTKTKSFADPVSLNETREINQFGRISTVMEWPIRQYTHLVKYVSDFFLVVTRFYKQTKKQKTKKVTRF